MGDPHINRSYPVTTDAEAVGAIIRGVIYTAPMAGAFQDDKIRRAAEAIVAKLAPQARDVAQPPNDLLKYANHLTNCRYRGGHDCDCGLDEIREEYRSGTPAQPVLTRESVLSAIIHAQDCGLGDTGPDGKWQRIACNDKSLEGDRNFHHADCECSRAADAIMALALPSPAQPPANPDAVKM